MSEITIKDVPTIVRREIEALILVPFLKAFSAELGDERMREIATAVMGEIATKAGKDFAARVGENTIGKFVEELLPDFKSDWKVLECNEEQARFDFYTCDAMDLYDRLGCREYGTLLSCGRDPYMFPGYNENIELTRTCTLMEGGDRCDFCLSMKKKEEK